MKTKKTYFIKRNEIYIWAFQEELKETDEIIEEREMVIADDGKVLVRNDEIIGTGIWLKDTEITDYTEIDEPIEEEEIEDGQYDNSSID